MAPPPAKTRDRSAAGDPAPSERRRVGRPPKLDRQMIAEAAHELGLSGLTMKAVADRLGVSVPGLYHHIEGKGDLMRLAAEYSAGRIELPEDRGQHWAVWLCEWARYNRAAFMAQPELLKQFIEGAVSTDRTAATIEIVLAKLGRDGFSVAEAWRAYGTISDFAVGAAVIGLRERRASEQGRPAIAEFHRVLAQSGPEDFPQLRRMLPELSVDVGDAFGERLLLVIRGLCEDRGERWSTVRAKL
ncbi:MAG TPA: TetR/AcrR family transcriptional regulator C-terminal domain-containing protein [Acidimicrobiia bacterium]|nr:TetR/AcrR family transcriptional regulator C-terminal domain-containing protein [Acidimicrobiia bacterium]